MSVPTSSCSSGRHRRDRAGRAGRAGPRRTPSTALLQRHRSAPTGPHRRRRRRPERDDAGPAARCRDRRGRPCQGTPHRYRRRGVRQHHAETHANERLGSSTTCTSRSNEHEFELRYQPIVHLADESHHRRGGADPLAPSQSRDGPTRRVHPARRRHRAHHRRSAPGCSTKPARNFVRGRTPTPRSRSSACRSTSR